MNYSLLSLAQTPPLSVPFRYFATAPLFLGAAAVLLIWHGPDALSSRWSPAALALTHLATLGVLSMVMAGAFQQILPVLIGAPVPRPRLVSAAVHSGLSIGTVLLVAAFLGAGPVAARGAVVILAAAFLIFLAVSIYSLARATASGRTVATLRFAIAALAVTVGLGLHLAAGYGWPLPLARGLTDVHLAWGLLGWVGLLVAGVGYQVVPMFQITPNYPEAMQRWLAPAAVLALLAWTLSSTYEGVPGPLGIIGGAALALIFAAFAGVTLRLQQRRRRRLPDATLAYWRLSMAGLLLAVMFWMVGLPLTGMLAVVLFIVGFALSAISGMLYKIVPFLIWLHLNNRLRTAGVFQGGIPNMKQIIPEPMARGQFRVHLLALIVLTAAVPIPALVRPAGLLMLVSAGFLLVNLLGALRLYRRILRERAPA